MVGFIILIIYLFVWWHWVLVAACGLFFESCRIFLMSPPRNSEAGSSLRTSALVFMYRRRSFISTAADGAVAGLLEGGGRVRRGLFLKLN